MKPRLLDLFCGAGGAAMGYHRAGFDVVGVDIRPQPNYPFDFHLRDALRCLQHLLDGGLVAFRQEVHRDGATWRWHNLAAFDAIHASPPCQRYSTATKRNGTELDHPDLVGPTRELLQATGLPYVIENVEGTPLINPTVLCGCMFGLEVDGYRLRRRRLFERSWNRGFDFQCTCGSDPRPVMDVTGGGPTHKPRTDSGGGRPYKGTADQARRIMGIDWMTKTELNEAIPPAYTELIGHQLLARRLCDMQGLCDVDTPQMAQPSRLLRRLDRDFVTWTA